MNTLTDMKSLITIASIIFFHFAISAQSIILESFCDSIAASNIIYEVDSLDGVTIRMLEEQNPVGPDPLCEMEVINNPGWLAFVAKEGDYSITLNVSNCTLSSEFTGIQYAIYSNCDFTENIFCQGACSTAATTLSSSLFATGETYFLVINGCQSNTCDVTLTIDDYVPLGSITEWQSSVGGLGGSSQFNYFYNGDTIISGNQYRKIDVDPNPGFLSTRYIREESKKVFEYSTFSNSESKIYDFTLVVGDEFEYSNGFTSTVINIDTIEISNVKYTRWELDGAGPSYQYLEGIGGDHLFYADQLGISDPVYSTSCVYKYCDKIIGAEDCFSKMSWDTGSNIDTSICQGEEIIFGDFTISDQGVYTNIYTNSVGCDSVVVLSVSILALGSTTLQESICEGESLTVNGITFDEFSPNGTIIIQGGSANGCDSIVSVDVSFIPTIVEDYQATICEGSSEIWAGDTITMAGEYTFQLFAASGCDSIINLSVEVIPDITTEFSIELCEGFDVDINGVSYTETGVYEFEYEASTGCDSVVIYDLNFLPPIHVFDSLMICQGDSVTIDQFVISAPGDYQYNYTSVSGCDSIVNITVGNFPEIVTEFALELCDGTDVDIEGESYTETGVYEFEYEASTGCDSIVIYDLEFLPAVEMSDTLYICPGDSVLIDNVFVTTQGIFQSTNEGINGCDSISVIMVVQLLPSDSECLTGVYDLTSFEVQISPNPFHQSLKLISKENIQSLEVTSISGIQMYYLDRIDSKTYDYEPSNLPDGVYILTLKSKDKIAIERIVKH